MKRINRIKEVLVIKGRTQVWLASQLSKEPHTVSLWCTNKRQPSLIDLDKIAEILDVEIRELLIPTKS